MTEQRDRSSETRHAHDNRDVYVIETESKGIGLAARSALSKGALIIRSPVKVLSTMEYQLLRLAPVIGHYWDRQVSREEIDPVLAFTRGVDKLLEDPDEVLGTPIPADADHGAIMHTFSWPKATEHGVDTAAIAFGLSSLCNHAEDPEEANAELVRHQEIGCIDLVAIRDIEAGTEILIRYASTPFSNAGR